MDPIRPALSRLLEEVGRGQVTTSGRLAQALGDASAARFVGRWGSEVALSVSHLPWHRILTAEGRLPWRAASLRALAAERLKGEGLSVRGGRVQVPEGAWHQPGLSSPPLAALRRERAKLKRRLLLRGPEAEVRWFGGFDASYDGDVGFGALVVLNRRTLEVEHARTARRRVDFPYIPGYLAYRELPLAEALLTPPPEETILFVDGNGTLHPEGFGVASHVGVVCGLPTIGIAKRLLCGTVNRRPLRSGEWPVRVGGEVRGYAFGGTPGSARPRFYASIGHRVGRTAMLTAVREATRGRLPEPILRADAEARRARAEAAR